MIFSIITEYYLFFAMLFVQLGVNIFGSAAPVHDMIPGIWIGNSDWARRPYLLQRLSGKLIAGV